jgi:hypothetical protein
VSDAEWDESEIEIQIIGPKKFKNKLKNKNANADEYERFNSSCGGPAKKVARQPHYPMLGEMLCKFNSHNQPLKQISSGNSTLSAMSTES